MKLSIQFENLPVAEAGKKVNELKKHLLSIEDVRLDIEQHDESNQDFGTTLVLVLGTPTAIALAKGISPAMVELSKGISAYLSRSRATIKIERNGKVIATGLGGNDAARIAEAFSQR